MPSQYEKRRGHASRAEAKKFGHQHVKVVVLKYGDDEARTAEQRPR